jgi:hypothetical protein
MPLGGIVDPATAEVKLMSAKDTQSDFDQAKAEAFAGKLLTALNNGTLCLMVSIGHRTGLFDIMSQSPPTRSEEIATRARLNERYVRSCARCLRIGTLPERPSGDQAHLSCLAKHHQIVEKPTVDVEDGSQPSRDPISGRDLTNEANA